ncbi:hypothetical protein CC1G_15357 [Coprinopsis cinerea okayama7|uniref:Uncharacterized protein n=1 Tax=Coprinopsis cinerea (strain Okayama-7 / 130 / ATCC MYA-4618 / FGSC 9003) TaxID=240176 RepID=D6RQ36_COPC7|nr:hypothetical protein CC1G_15357 [Coprinopsis cinerea okayama7\|eukprot:XP_002910450.1 hypothetical protein CC1G_15357 [Coprinopsis cinerea okayama7\
MHQSLNTWLADHLHTPKARGIEEDPSRTHQLRRAIPIEAALEETFTWDHTPAFPSVVLLVPFVVNP